MKTHRLLIAAALATLFAAPALAQSESATLRIDSGSAMVSSGGEFTSAASGTQLAPGSRVMLTEGSRATLVYPNGCTQALGAAGVHGVPATCVSSRSAAVVPAQAGATGVDMGGAAIISGIAVAGAAVLHAMDDEDYVPPPPVSR
ncbi:hypothetical protein [Luteimonas changyuni]|uniref:hypothetical protein n=1 Tax=Luteimonas sp. MJ145 TaxID=3129234 RepID=UPI0031BA5E50